MQNATKDEARYHSLQADIDTLVAALKSIREIGTEEFSNGAVSRGYTAQIAHDALRQTNRG